MLSRSLILHVKLHDVLDTFSLGSNSVVSNILPITFAGFRATRLKLESPDRLAMGQYE